MTIRNSLRLALLALVTLSLTAVCSAGDASAAGLSCTGLAPPIPPGPGLVTAGPVSCTVDCAAGGTVASALALRPNTTNRLTITIQGTCNEAVTIGASGNVTLQAANAGDGLGAPSSSANPVLDIQGPGSSSTI
jgi:hypothetical protein